MDHRKAHVSTLSAAELSRCKSSLSRRLYALRAALLEQRESGDRAAEDVVTADVHDLKDDAFAGHLANLRGVAIDQVQGELAAVHAALNRITDGSFGHCEDCAGEISRERLLAQPSAARCLRCQEAAEEPRSVR